MGITGQAGRGSARSGMERQGKAEISFSEWLLLVEQGERWAEEQARNRRKESLCIQSVGETKRTIQNVANKDLSPEVIMPDARTQWANRRSYEQIFTSDERGQRKTE